MSHFTYHCEGEAVARAICDAITTHGQAVVSITGTGPFTVWYRCAGNDEQIATKVRHAAMAAEKEVLRVLAA